LQEQERQKRISEKKIILEKRKKAWHIERQRIIAGEKIILEKKAILREQESQKRIAEEKIILEKKAILREQESQKRIAEEKIILEKKAILREQESQKMKLEKIEIQRREELIKKEYIKKEEMKALELRIAYEAEINLQEIRREFRDNMYNSTYTFEHIMKVLGVSQIRVSFSLKHLRPRILNKFKLKGYSDAGKPCIFFGVYHDIDIAAIKQHNGPCYVMPAGSDFPRCGHILRKDTVFLAISTDIRQRFIKYNQKNILIAFNIVDNTLFVPPSTTGHKIFIYDGFQKKAYNREIYGDKYYEEVVKRLPWYEYIFSSKLSVPYEGMPEIYSQCFIGLRLTPRDGNANTVQEMEAMGIPIVHNQSEYGLKWDNINDVIDHIKTHDEIYSEIKSIKKRIYDATEGYDDHSINIDTLTAVNSNIDDMVKFLQVSLVENILFICSDYPGYGGAATNCDKLSEFFSLTFNTYSVYWNWETEKNKKYEKKSNYEIIDQSQLNTTLCELSFKPDIVILKSPQPINIKSIFKCPLIFLVPGLYKNNLDKFYYDINDKLEHDKYVNNNILEQIKISDHSFCNSLHTKKILHDIYGLKTGIFYSTFIPYYKQKIYEDACFSDRKYQYGLIMSNFDRKIKNVEKSIEFLKGKPNVILIGEGSKKYKSYGFACTNLVERSEMENYYVQIKYIIQDSFFESCSNVKIEGLFNGCKMKPVIVVSSTQYPGYGGAATNAYTIIKNLRAKGYTVAGVFFHSTLIVNYDPEKIGGIFLYHYSKYIKEKVIKNCINYLGAMPMICLAKNYVAPAICKKIFNVTTIFLMSGCPFFSDNTSTSAEMLLDNKFKTSYTNRLELNSISKCDIIVCNSLLMHNICKKIYPQSMNKLYNIPIDTSYMDITNKIDNSKDYQKREYDIIICGSRMDRKQKNIKLALEIFKDNRCKKYKKIVIGGQSKEYFKNCMNTTCFDILPQKECIKYMKMAKILLVPSFFDSNPNICKEALFSGCLPVITRNIGYYQNYPEVLICNNFEKECWIEKITHLLDNSDKFGDLHKEVIFDGTSIENVF
jgi:glycosyltransferase involved in cell wall biosynthesis